MKIKNKIALTILPLVLALIVLTNYVYSRFFNESISRGAKTA
jgi:hypothetical protein